jgi:hypothetical protein
MFNQFKEIYHDNKESVREQIDKVRAIRARAAANRALNLNHPEYQRQFRRDIARSIMTAGVAAAASVSLLVHTLGMDSRSEERAEKICNEIGCKENLILFNLQKGINPENDPRIRDRPSFLEIKKQQDAINWEQDREWIKIGAYVTIPSDVLAGLYLIYPMLNHRRKVMQFQSRK